MGKLDKITFEEQSGEIKDKVQEYWTERADGFFELRHAELESNKAERWLGEISKYIPDGKTIKILDVGCGTGYFEIILGQAGHNITGIDLTE
ncbi:MAG: methyltransferase domain-containing protein, partial [Eubacteriales bacterium]|nr:methyltransferase domain-containing protein [Eubacteriales bacterium]